jgi:hypothetical protein
MATSNPFVSDNDDDDFNSFKPSFEHDDSKNPFRDDKPKHEHDDFCANGGCTEGSSGTDNSSHVKDTARHPGRKVRARVADFVGGGDAYAGPKEEKEEKAPKKPLRDRIADKIATKPKDEDSSSSKPSGSSADSSGPTFEGVHFHGFDCSDPKNCTEKGVGE